MSEGALSLTAHERAQASIERAVALLEELDMDPGKHGVYFGQLLGMADPLTYVLGRNGFRVSVLEPQLISGLIFTEGVVQTAELALYVCGRSRRVGLVSGCPAEAFPSMHLTCCYP